MATVVGLSLLKLENMELIVASTNDKNRPRAVFAPDDYELLKKAIGSYIRTCEQYCVAEEEMNQALSLYHRLGRLSDGE